MTYTSHTLANKNRMTYASHTLPSRVCVCEAYVILFLFASVCEVYVIPFLFGSFFTVCHPYIDLHFVKCFLCYFTCSYHSTPVFHTMLPNCKCPVPCNRGGFHTVGRDSVLPPPLQLPLVTVSKLPCQFSGKPCHPAWRKEIGTSSFSLRLTTTQLWR